MTKKLGLTFRHFFYLPPQIRADYAPNLSILVRAGKENNSDSTSNGEWRWKSSDLKSNESWSCNLWHESTNVLLSRSWIIHGKGSHRAWKPRLRGRREEEPISEICVSSRVVWDCSPKNCGVRPHRKLNMERRPIAKKYCEGKVKRTLKRESNRTWNRQEGREVDGMKLAFSKRQQCPFGSVATMQ